MDLPALSQSNYFYYEWDVITLIEWDVIEVV